MSVMTILVVMTAPPARAQDWTQWRGPHRDGAVMSFDEPTAWPDSLTRQWQVEVGLGYATPLLIGDRLFVFVRQGSDEVLMALDATSGDQIWQTSYAAPFEMNGATAPHREGPKSTPTYAAGRLFTLGMSGIVTAFDTETGRQLWQRPGDPVQPLFHTAMSPVVDGDLMVLHIGGHNDGALTAFEAATGAMRWQWDGVTARHTGLHSSWTSRGVRQVVVFTQENFVGIARDTGELLWRRPFTTRATTTSQTPIIYDGDVIQAGRGNGITRFEVIREDNAWTTRDLLAHG